MTSLLGDIGWEKPYSIEKTRIWFWVTYFITYEDTRLLGPLEYNDAKVICGALNGAYNMGRVSEITKREWEKEEEKCTA